MIRKLTLATAFAAAICGPSPKSRWAVTDLAGG
jgi:hypothetical protein